MDWWKDPDKLRQRLGEHASVRELANATGVPRSTIGDWARRLGINSIPLESPVKWGQGAAQLVKPATREPWERVVFLSDVHVPYQDHALVESALALIRQVEPHRVVLNGDINDFFQLSRFNTSQQRLDSLQEEIDEGVEFRRGVREAAPAAVISETEGNHDSRTRTYVSQNAQALSSLRALRPENLFGYRELGVDWYPGAGFLLRNHFLVKHGTLLRGEAGATAKAELQQAGISGTSGHTHRLGIYRRAGYVQREWGESGCLCRLDPDYVVGRPNWVQGCLYGEFSTRSDAFHLWEARAAGGELRLPMVAAA